MRWVPRNSPAFAVQRPLQYGRRSDGSFDRTVGPPPVPLIGGPLRRALTREPSPQRLSSRGRPIRYSAAEFGESGSKEAEQFLSQSVDEHSHVPADQLDQHHSALKQIINRLTPQALNRYQQSIKAYRFFKDPNDLTAAMLKDMPQMAASWPKGKTVRGGFMVNGHLYLTDPATLDGKKLSHLDNHSHEVAHVLDQHRKLSSRDDWTDAWEKEIAPSGISRRAATSPHEGWAEFGRLVLGGRIPLYKLQRMFPASSAVWKRNLLWPASQLTRLSRRGPRIRYSAADFARTVRAVYPKARQVDEDTFFVQWPGRRTIYINHEPRTNRVWLQFANNKSADEDTFSSGKKLRKGSLGLMRSLSALVGGFKEAGFHLTFEAEPRRAALYDKGLTRSGYKKTSPPHMDPVYSPVPDQPEDRPVQMARLHYRKQLPKKGCPLRSAGSVRILCPACPKI